MFTSYAARSALALLFAATAASTNAEDEEVEFKGYDRTAEIAIENLLDTIGELRSYSDDATVEIKMSVGFGREPAPVSCRYYRPKRFRMRTQTHDLCGDGKKLIVYQSRMRRYTAEPLEKDIGKQVSPYMSTGSMEFSIGGLLLASDPGKYFSERFINLQGSGEETIAGERCILLEGAMPNVRRLDGSRGDADVTLWLRKSDAMIRRLELDMSPVDEQDEDEEEGPNIFRMVMRGVTLVYDVRDLKVDDPIEKSEFAFQPPKGSRKVDRFYANWAQAGDTAMQFELSGKPAPEFDLERTDGKWISLSSLRGNVVILDFLLSSFGFMRPPGLKELDMIRREYADRDVSVLCVLPEADADQLLDTMEKGDLKLPVVLDPGSNTTSAYFEEQFAQGIVLVDKKGIVQGRYPASLNKESVASLSQDIDKLLKGETLPGGQPLSEEQLSEVRAQRSASFSADADEPLNADDLKESWKVHALDTGGFGFGFGQGAAPSRGLWVRDKDTVREIDPRGKTIVQIPIPNPSHNQIIRDQFVVGRFGGRLAIAYMTTIPGDRSGGFGFRPPKGAVITVADESEHELWEMELETKGAQAPQHLQAGDLDGKAGDELLFHHQGNIWIVDGHGRVLVRRPLSGNPQWIRIQDLDGDDRDEVYVRTQDKLLRFDYRS